MPPLVAFGRKWAIGSDDFVFPGIRNLCVRIPWCIATGVIYWQNYEKLNCNGGLNIKIFLFGAFGILNLMILGDLILIYNSSLGTIMETKPRRFVPLCLYAKLVLYCTELGWNSWGTWAYAQKKFVCTDAPELSAVILGLIICNWLLLLLFLIFWVRQFDPAGTKAPNFELIPSDVFDYLRGPPATSRSGHWFCRLRLFFILVCGEAKAKALRQVYQTAARGFAYMFMHYDLVQSDLVAGTFLCGVKTRIAREKLIEQTYGSSGFTLKSSINFDPAAKSSKSHIRLPPSDDWNSIKNVLYFFKYAVTIFTIPANFVFFRNKFIKSFCCNIQCCNCLPGRKKPVRIVQDNFFYGKTAAIRTVVEDKDLAYASYDNSDFCCPFFVALDHSTKSIVISIRGSFSSVDFLVDCSVIPTPMDVPGLPAEFKAHHGFLTVAKTIKKRLDELQVLSKLVTSYPEYQIMVTGISLGAGVSTILSMMLHLEHKNLRCLAYAAPGAAVSLDAAEYCNDFVTSIAYGDDIIPRLGIPSFNKALNDIQSVLLQSKIPKYKIQFGMTLALLGLRKFRTEFHENTDPAKNTEIVPVIPKLVEDLKGDGMNVVNSEANLVQQSISAECIYSPEELRQQGLERFRHFPAGRILYFTESPAYFKRRTKGSVPAPRWEVKWANRTDFNDIIFSNRMIMDHIPLRLVNALKYFSKFSESEVPDVIKDVN